MPVIQPNNESFPAFYSSGRLNQLFENNKYEAFMNVSSPITGYWYSSAFIDNSHNKDVKPDVSCALSLIFIYLFVQILAIQIKLFDISFSVC